MNRRRRSFRRPASASQSASWRVLWSSDSIFNMGQLFANTGYLLPNASLTTDWATYGGNVIGGGLLELADSSQAYVSGAWSAVSRAVNYSAYSAVVFEFGRNDANNGENATEFRKAYDKLVAQGLGKFPRVVTSNCPPKANAGLLAWDAAADLFITNTHKTQIETAVAKWNTRHVDIFTKFTDLVTAGTYTIAQLMRDVYHPTTDRGAALIAGWVASALQDTTPAIAATPEITGSVVNYLYGQNTAGAWALTATGNVIGPTVSPVPRIANLTDQGNQVAASGAKLSFPGVTVSAGGQVWFHYFTKTAGGTFDAYVDRGAGGQKKVTVNTTDATIGGDNYPRSVLVGDNLSAGAHTIELETTNATAVCILGVTVVGV